MNNNAQGVPHNVSDALLSINFIDGRRSGLAENPSSLNPHPTGSVEFVEWKEGWRSGNRDLSYQDAMRCAA